MQNGDAENPSLLMPVEYAVSGSIAISCVLAFVWWRRNRDKRLFDEVVSDCEWSPPKFLIVELVDVTLDMSAYLLANLADDLTFANDHGIIKAALLASTMTSVTLFVIEVMMWVRLRSYKRQDEFWWGPVVEAFHLGFEDGFQFLVYTFAAASQISSGQSAVGTICGCAQASAFLLSKLIDGLSPRSRRFVTASPLPWKASSKGRDARLAAVRAAGLPAAPAVKWTTTPAVMTHAAALGMVQIQQVPAQAQALVQAGVHAPAQVQAQIQHVPLQPQVCYIGARQMAAQGAAQQVPAQARAQVPAQAQMQAQQALARAQGHAHCIGAQLKPAAAQVACNGQAVVISR